MSGGIVFCLKNIGKKKKNSNIGAIEIVIAMSISFLFSQRSVFYKLFFYGYFFLHLPNFCVTRSVKMFITHTSTGKLKFYVSSGCILFQKICVINSFVLRLSKTVIYGSLLFCSILLSLK